MTSKDNKKTLEQEAQEFVSNKDTTQIKVETNDFLQVMPCQDSLLLVSITLSLIRLLKKLSPTQIR